MKRTSRDGSLFERVERIQTQIDKSRPETIYNKENVHASWITKEFRL